MIMFHGIGLGKSFDQCGVGICFCAGYYPGIKLDIYIYISGLTFLKTRTPLLPVIFKTLMPVPFHNR
jgi:hypothetical protein